MKKTIIQGSPPKFFVAPDGTNLGAFSDAEPPEGSIEVPTQALHGKDTWDTENNIWIENAQARWESAMIHSDTSMTRSEEDVWDAIGLTDAPQSIKDKHEAKKTLRGTKP